MALRPPEAHEEVALVTEQATHSEKRIKVTLNR
jgi:hypothetical protein